MFRKLKQKTVYTTIKAKGWKWFSFEIIIKDNKSFIFVYEQPVIQKLALSFYKIVVIKW